MKKEKKVFVVIVNDEGSGILVSPEIFHIRAISAEQATQCAKEIFFEDYSFSLEDIEEELDFFTYEFKESEIIEA